MPFSPASVLTSGSFPNLVAIYYERQAIPNLKAETPFMGEATQYPLPLHSGNQIQFYTYALLSGNTSQAPEGTVGSPISESTTQITATIGQYVDFINSSDLSMDVAIDNPSLLQNLSNELNYRLALTLNSLVQITADTANSVDASVVSTLVNGSYLAASNVRSSVQSLVAVNAKPKANGRFGGIIHPNVVKDVFNDTSVNGLTDILKRSPEGASKLMSLPSNENTFEFGGVSFKQTTTAPTSTIGGNTYYNTYIFGEDALFAVFLGRGEGGDKNYRLRMQIAPENGTVSDPGRQVGGWVSYNVKFTTTLRPGTTMTMRVLQSETSSS